MEKPIVFISHINEEKDIAIALKHVVEGAFLGMMDVFVSADPTSIQMGQRWLDNITHALKHCAVEIILASPKSVNRPWINFEAGAGWIRDVAVIPLCHSGMTPSKLPSPLNTLQAATATEEAELRLIFPVLAKAIGSGEPSVSFSAFIERVRTYEEESKKIAAMSIRSAIASTDGLARHEQATLVAIAEASDAPDYLVSVYEIRSGTQAAGYTRLATTLAMAALERCELIETQVDQDFNGNDYACAKVTPEGWNWLEANKEILVLREKSRTASTPTDVSNEDEIPF